MAIEWTASARDKRGIMRYTGDGRFTISVERTRAGRVVQYGLEDSCNPSFSADKRCHRTLASAKACAQELLKGRHLQIEDDGARVELMKTIIGLPEEQREVAVKLVNYIDKMCLDASRDFYEQCRGLDSQIDDLDSRINRLRDI